MSTITFEIEKRDEAKNPRQLRAEGNLPGTIYGKDKQSVSVQFNRREFINVYKNNKEATYELKLGKETYNTIVQNLQIHASTQEPMNVEFKLV